MVCITSGTAFHLQQCRATSCFKQLESLATIETSHCPKQKLKCKLDKFFTSLLFSPLVFSTLFSSLLLSLLQAKRGKKDDDGATQDDGAVDGDGQTQVRKKKKRSKGAIAANPDVFNGDFDANECIGKVFAEEARK